LTNFFYLNFANRSKKKRKEKNFEYKKKSELRNRKLLYTIRRNQYPSLGLLLLNDEFFSQKNKPSKKKNVTKDFSETKTI